MKESAGKKDSVEDTSSKKKFFHFMRSFGAKWLLLLCSKSNKRIVITKDFQELARVHLGGGQNNHEGKK